MAASYDIPQMSVEYLVIFFMYGLGYCIIIKQMSFSCNIFVIIYKV